MLGGQDAIVGNAPYGGPGSAQRNSTSEFRFIFTFYIGGLRRYIGTKPPLHPADRLEKVNITCLSVRGIGGFPQFPLLVR